MRFCLLIFIYLKKFLFADLTHIYIQEQNTAHPSSLLNSAVCPSIYSCAAACVRVEQQYGSSSSSRGGQVIIYSNLIYIMIGPFAAFELRLLISFQEFSISFNSYVIAGQRYQLLLSCCCRVQATIEQLQFSEYTTVIIIYLDVIFVCLGGNLFRLFSFIFSV